MAINSSSAEFVTHQGLADKSIASATDRHLGQLREETDAIATNRAQYAWEANVREEANMEIGRARNLVTVV